MQQTTLQTTNRHSHSTMHFQRRTVSEALSSSKVYREAGKRNRFSFMNKSFNVQGNLTKFSTLIVNGYDYINAAYFFSGIYTNFRRLLCKKCVAYDIASLTKV